MRRTQTNYILGSGSMFWVAALFQPTAGMVLIVANADRDMAKRVKEIEVLRRSSEAYQFWNLDECRNT
jgi:hypothetical protein